MSPEKDKNNSLSEEIKDQSNEYLILDAIARIVHKFNIDFEENKKIRGFIYKSFIQEDLIARKRTYKESLDSLKLFTLAIKRLKKDGLVKSYKITTNKLAGMEGLLNSSKNWCIESVIDEELLLKNLHGPTAGILTIETITGKLTINNHNGEISLSKTSLIISPGTELFKVFHKIAIGNGTYEELGCVKKSSRNDLTQIIKKLKHLLKILPKTTSLNKDIFKNNKNHSYTIIGP